MLRQRTLLRSALSIAALGGVAACDGVDTEPGPDLDVVTLEARTGDRATRAWDFGETNVFLESPALGLTISNESRATSDRVDVTVLGDGAGHFVATGDCKDVYLTPRATCSLRVRFQPTVAGVHRATVRVAEDGGAAVEIALVGTGTGSGADPVLIVDSDDLNFMIAAADDDVSDLLTVGVRNASPRDITDLATVVSGPGFSIDPTGCGSTLRAYDTCLVFVRLIPTMLGPLTGRLDITGGGRAATVALRGTGAFNVNASVWSGQGQAAGLLTSEPAALECDIRCGVTSPCQQICKANFTGDVRLVATPGPGSRWGGWILGPCTGSLEPVCDIPAGVAAVEVGGSWLPEETTEPDQPSSTKAP
jgi:hypothetical protein